VLMNFQAMLRPWQALSGTARFGALGGMTGGCPKSLAYMIMQRLSGRRRA